LAGKNANFAGVDVKVPPRSHLEAIDIFRPAPPGPYRRTEGEGGMAGPAGMAPGLQESVFHWKAFSDILSKGRRLLCQSLRGPRSVPLMERC
jgi:hypothetical protein